MKLFKVNGRRIAAKTIADAVEAYKANKEGDCKDAAGVDFDYLLAEERKAVNDYRTAISQTDDPKLLTVLSHILKEETEHIEELEAARKGVYEDKGLQDALGTSYENENYKREWKETLSLWEEYKSKAGNRRDYDIGEYMNGDPALNARQKIMTKNGPDRPNWRGHAAVRKVLKEILSGKKPVYQGQVLDAYGTTMIGNGPLATFAGKKNTYYVLKVKSRENGGGWGPEKYLVTSADYKDRGASLYGTFENTLGEAKQTAKRYAERDSVKDTAYLRTPRGTFELVNESEEMLRHKGWGMWFEHEENGKLYRIMGDGTHAVAVFVRNV